MVLFVSSNNAYSTEIDQYNVTIDVSSEELAFVQMRAIYNSLTTENLSFVFFNQFSNFKAADDQGLLSCVFSKSAIGTEVICDPHSNRKTINKSNPYSVALSFDVHDIVAKRQTPLVLFIHLVANPTDTLRVRMVLPEGKILPESQEILPYYPENAQIGGTGRRVIVEWNLNKPELGNRINFTINYESTLSKSLAVIITVVVLLILIVVVFFYYRSRQTKAETVISILKEDEKKVIDVIRAHGGSCKQKDIVKETDFSKAKVSRIVTLLEERGLLRKDRKGRTNKVFLSDGKTKKKEKTEEKKESRPVMEEKKELPKEESESKRPFGQ